METPKYEYFLEIWGGFFNNPTHGFKDGNYWFESKLERKLFLDAIVKAAKSHEESTFVTAMSEGYDVRKKRLVTCDLQVGDKIFTVTYELPYYYTAKDCTYRVTLGNDACDCARSRTIREQHGKDAMDKLYCGETIILRNFKLEFV